MKKERRSYPCSKLLKNDAPISSSFFISMSLLCKPLSKWPQPNGLPKPSRGSRLINEKSFKEAGKQAGWQYWEDTSFVVFFIVFQGSLIIKTL